MRAIVTALATVAAVALAFPSTSEAHGQVSGQVVFQSPVAVFGFSYGDPYVVGHVHHGPVACAHGPLYYYPTYQVYGHYYPRHRYTYYHRPHYVKPYYAKGHRHHNGHGRYDRGHRHHDRCDHGGHGKYQRVRGHGR